MAYKTFTAGTLATASDVNTYLMKQSVMVFTTTTARDAALTSPTDGMLTFQTTDDAFTIRDGGTWRTIDVTWKDYTPSFANFTVGNATVTGKYFRIGRLVHFIVSVTLGTTSSVSPTGGIQASLPVAYTSTARFHGTARMAVGSTFMGTLIGSGGNAVMYVNNVSGTYETLTLTTNAIPGTWATGHTFLMQGTYEA